MKVLFATVLLLCVFALAGCGANDQYAINDRDGYSVSVQYHANGGEFATNTFTITDCYKPDGKSELMLIDPNSEDRQERFEAKRNGYFLAGWYTERKDTGKKDENGEGVLGNIILSFVDKIDSQKN